MFNSHDAARDAAAQGVRKPLAILLIGNSHTYFNDMPQLFAEMCGMLTGQKADVTMLAYSNRGLDWHCEEYFALRFALLYGQYDYCVMQQFGHPFPGEDKTFPYAKRIMSLCEKGGTKPVIYMTWARKQSPEDIAEVSRAYRKLAAETGALLVPVGELFDSIRREHPEIELFWKDEAHASAYGDYLIAAAFAALLCGSDDLSALSDEGFDSGIEIEGSDGKPSALEDVAAVRVTLDPKKTAAIRTAVMKAVSLFASDRLS